MKKISFHYVRKIKNRKSETKWTISVFTIDRISKFTGAVEHDPAVVESECSWIQNIISNWSSESYAEEDQRVNLIWTAQIRHYFITQFKTGKILVLQIWVISVIVVLELWSTKESTFWLLRNEFSKSLNKEYTTSFLQTLYRFTDLTVFFH